MTPELWRMTAGACLVIVDIYIYVRSRHSSAVVGQLVKWACVVAFFAFALCAGSLMVIFTQAWISPKPNLSLVIYQITAVAYLLSSGVAIFSWLVNKFR
ncbi:hypothetical protein [Luteibacter anthropi]|uniref:Uncharacterized protein n=1 Tax=Luteibacter anthropi TaxID=564369 RepID=A0A7X5UBR9_9GAMM|nr:hypothetical protein [Luteibacter anthropi]NII07397.1 hypothetical protein [Luteibacter anthropi]